MTTSFAAPHFLPAPHNNRQPPTAMTASTTPATTLESLLDSSRVQTDPALSTTQSNGIPAVVAKPVTAEEAAAVVRYATTEKLSVIPTGCRTKLQIGASPSRYDIALDMSGLQEIAHYDPADLTISVGAGMRLAALNATLLEHNQFLPLLVPYYSSATIGGAIASGLDSPLRQLYGTARDFLLGAEFIDGTGALVKSGGRVVKNVTGYDLHKTLVGSLGNLAAITRLNFRTFPAPTAEQPRFRSLVPKSPGRLHSPQENIRLATRPAHARHPESPSRKNLGHPHAQRPGTRNLRLRRIHPATPRPLVPPRRMASMHGVRRSTEVLDRYSRDLTRFAEETSATNANFSMIRLARRFGVDSAKHFRCYANFRRTPPSSDSASCPATTRRRLRCWRR